MTTTELRTHPAAEVWPLLGDDELGELADDIAANGLIHPIVLTPDGEVLDGRNRLRACDRAGIEPEFVTHTGDPVAYVLGANALRRHMSKGARAMAAVSIMDRRNADVAATADVSMVTVGRAAVVAKWAPDMVADVISGAVPLDQAYGYAKLRKDQANSRESKMAVLTEQAPDLAALVADETMTLDDAGAVLLERAKRAKQEADELEKTRARAADVTRSAVAFLANPAFLTELTTRLPSMPVAPDLDELTAARDALTVIIRSIRNHR